MLTQADKDLLIKDLCGRLPYSVKCEVIDRGIKVIGTLNSYTLLTTGSKLFGLSNKEYDAPIDRQPKAQFLVEEIKPYLRSMKNMTEDEENEYKSTCIQLNGIINIETFQTFDWFNKHHFDYRSLIEKGLALEAPEEMY